MRYLFLFVLLFASVGVLSAQSIPELEKELKEADSNKERMLLNFQLAEEYYRAVNMRKSDRFEKAETYAKEAHRLAGQEGNRGMTAQAAYLLANIYENLAQVGDRGKRRRYARNIDVWLRNAAAAAELVGDYDLILKAYQDRARLYSEGSDKNYRKAFQVMEEGLAVLTKNGNSISKLQSNYSREEVKLDRAIAQLQAEINKLQQEKGNLVQKNTNLSKTNREAKQEINRKSTVIKEKDEVISAKEDSLALAAEREEEIKEKAQQYEQKYANLTERAAKDSLARAVAEKELLVKENELQQTELLRQQAAAYQNYLMIGIGAIFILAILFYSRYLSKKRANRKLQEEQERSENLLLNILPKDVAEELKHNGRTKAKKHDNVTVFFSDFKNFTKIAEQLSPEELVAELDKCFKKFDFIIQKYPDIEKIKTIGDAYMCASGLNSKTRYPFNMIRASLEMQKALDELKQENIRMNKPYFEARIGIHTGPVVAGVVGTTKFVYDIWGDTVNVASRMESKGEIGRVNISEDTFNLIRYKFDCEYRGKVDAKNKGLIDMYFVRKELATAGKEKAPAMA